MKFAHLSDIHLGFQKHEALQEIEQNVFEKTLDECISRKVDFILIPGDMFHVNIPEMRVQKYAFAKFKQVHDAGIPVYVVYGSHDFSPVANSVIDLLAETGYITKVTKVKESTEEKITLDFLQDEKTQAKIAGFSGLKKSKDREYYEKLDRASLESESGFKIFVFHGGISEMKAGMDPGDDYMPLSLLPKNFDYYAGGHFHTFSHEKYDKYPNVVYPGTLFAGFHSDLEENAKGKVRGFVLVEFEDKIENIEFVKIENANYELIEIDANNKKADSVNQELWSKVKDIDPAQKIIILKVAGELTSGKTADVDLSLIREDLIQKGSLVVNISKNKLTSREYSITAASGESKDEIETNVFKENIGQVRTKEKELVGNDGVVLAKKLLKEFAQPLLVNEKKAEYQVRIQQGILELLGLEQDDS